MSDVKLSHVIQPLLTDLYQIKMAYAYWKAEKIQDRAVFDLFFRRNPFQGEFTIFAGLGDCLGFLENFKYSESDIRYLKQTLPPTVEDDFYSFLYSISAKDVTLHAIPEGSVVFPRIPLLSVEGPLIVVQLLETILLTLVNYASLMTTNAARYRMAAGNMELFEFGLRRAQGPDGGLSASKYSYIGGFDATSNVLAGKLYNIPVKGTHAHAYVTSFTCLGDLKNSNLPPKNGGESCNLLQLALRRRDELMKFFKFVSLEAKESELAAFVSYAVAFPNEFLALIDTYDVRRSGLLNFSCVAMALNDLGYKALGVRIDSGDLAYLSIFSRNFFTKISRHFGILWFKDLTIIASNDINEETILSLNEQGHEINCLGIGTHLVTCQKQPALGCVYKLVELNGQPRIKLSQDVAKVTIPGKKTAYRLYSESGHALADLLQKATEAPPTLSEKILCRHPFVESKRAYVMPSHIEELLKVYWKDGAVVGELPDLEEIREKVKTSLNSLRPDIKRHLNPTPYKVSVSDNLYVFLHNLWLENAPIGELS